MQLLSRTEKEMIYKRWCQGETQTKLAEELYVSAKTVYRAIKEMRESTKEDNFGACQHKKGCD